MCPRSPLNTYQKWNYEEQMNMGLFFMGRSPNLVPSSIVEMQNERKTNSHGSRRHQQLYRQRVSPSLSSTHLENFISNVGKTFLSRYKTILLGKCLPIGKYIMSNGVKNPSFMLHLSSNSVLVIIWALISCKGQLIYYKAWVIGSGLPF